VAGIVGTSNGARALRVAVAAALAASLAALLAAASPAKAKPAIAVVSAAPTGGRIAVKVRIAAAPAKARWRLRVDGKAVATLPVRTKAAATPFLAPGDHVVQAQLVTAKGASVAKSASRPAHVDAVVAVAGDISCDPTDPNYAGTGSECHQRQTAALLAQTRYHAVFTLGDEQYECGSLDGFTTSYASTWGKYKSITYPTPGDHEYGTTKLNCPKGTNAAGYYTYWGPRAGAPGQGWYSFDLGGWHVVVLNSNCIDIGGCGAGSVEEQWLAADLAAHPATCTLAYWHEPRFTSAFAGDNPSMDAFWRDLYAAHVDLVLNGHAHVYERFVPQNPDGVAAPDGITEIIAGTGGRSLSGFQPAPEPTSSARGTAYGILQLSLGAGGFRWRFVPEAGASFADAGSAACH
jgi:hypothetical protein